MPGLRRIRRDATLSFGDEAPDGQRRTEKSLGRERDSKLTLTSEKELDQGDGIERQTFRRGQLGVVLERRRHGGVVLDEAKDGS